MPKFSRIKIVEIMSIAREIVLNYHYLGCPIADAGAAGPEVGLQGPDKCNSYFR